MQGITHKTIAALVLAAGAALTVTACGGGDAQVRSEVTTTTKGQQLLDLQKALEAGAISKDEYERERKKVLEQK